LNRKDFEIFVEAYQSSTPDRTRKTILTEFRDHVDVLPFHHPLLQADVCIRSSRIWPEGSKQIWGNPR